jgi:hypothetical protein
MRRRPGAFVLATLPCVAAAGPAGAALLTLAGGTLSVQVGPFAHTFDQNVPSVLVSATSGGGFVEPAGIFTGTQALPTSIFLPLPRFTIAGLANLTKSIAPGAAGGGHASGLLRPGGGLGGPGPLQGDAIVNVLGLFNLVVPLEAVGSTGGTAQVPAGLVAVSVFGTGWTTAAVQVTGVSTGTAPTSNAAIVNTVTFAGYDNRTPLHGGVIALVSPFKVVTSAASSLSGFALQTLTFSGGVPEPGAGVLVATALAALALRGWAGRVRSRRR